MAIPRHLWGGKKTEDLIVQFMRRTHPWARRREMGPARNPGPEDLVKDFDVT